MRTRNVACGWAWFNLIGFFRRLAQVLGIRTVVHDAVMHVRTPRLLVVHRMMVRWSVVNSTSGALVIRTRSAS